MRICLASQYGEGSWYCWKMSKEGHESSAIVGDERYEVALGGLIEVMPGDQIYEPETYDLVVFDSTGNGRYADDAATKVPTIGDSELADKLEEDRIFALDFMQKCGLQVPTWEGFDNPADGISYIKKRKTRMVFKPVGEQDDKSTTYVSRDWEDMLRYFDVLFRSAQVKQFVLQDVVKGIECGTNVWINDNGYYAISHDAECKKLMDGDVGPNTGCSGNAVWMPSRENPLFEKGLKKCIEPLQEMGYVGPMDLATIVNPEGVWALEFTPRFGYDSTQLLTRLLPIGFGDFLYAIAAGENVPDLTPKHRFCASVRVSIPPYPCEGLPKKAYKEGVPVEGLKEEHLDKFYVYDVRKRGESDDLETAGICGWVGSPLAVDDNIADAFECAYDMLKEVRVPQMQYRTDIAQNVTRRYLQLREGGWLKP